MKLTSALLLLLFGTSLTAQDAPSARNVAVTSAVEKPLGDPPASEGQREAQVSSISPADLEGFDHYAPPIQHLIRSALNLTLLNLTYTFGSSDPKRGGMDCSGTIYHLLHEFGVKDVPRQSNDMAAWVQHKTLLHRITTADTLAHPEFYALRPGDLLFWSGTYDTSPRSIPVTHVMLYLGKLKKDGRHVIFGASDGRSYQGQRRTGVSVFDFSLPKSNSSSPLYGYGMIPGAGRITPDINPAPTLVTAGPKAWPEPAEVIRPALPSSAPQKQASAPKNAAAKVTSAPAKPKPTGAKTPAQPVKRPAPTPPTAQEQIRKTMKTVADSVRDWVKK